MSATLEKALAHDQPAALVRAGIVGLGCALPERVVGNAEISAAIGVAED